MKRAIFYFVLFCLTISFTFANNSALDYYNAGKKFQQRENFTRAIEYYQEALLINPDYADAWIGLAECAYEMDEYSRALTCLETANKYYKYNLKIQRLKGFCYIGLGDLEKANVIFDEIKPNPTIENVQAGVAAYKKSGAEYIIAVGGGSSIDTAKAVGIINTNPN